MGVNDQPFGDWEGAGRLQRTLLLDFHQADAAGAFRRQGRVVAQDRDVDARLLRDLQESFVRLQPGFFYHQWLG